MSRFLQTKYNALEPYVPGEQPKEREYIKLNTNEFPYPPSPGVARAVGQYSADLLRLYPDPDATALRGKLAAQYGVTPDSVYLANGSDDILNFAFMAFCGPDTPAFFPDITYGFYRVFAALNGVPYTQIPLTDRFAVEPNAYCGVNGTVFLANPNAPTGRALAPEQIEQIVRSNPDYVVVVDEAYVDFGGVSVLPLIQKYDNLLVVQTFSKSRAMAGARLGFAFGHPALIADLNRLRYSTNPYNINLLTQAAGVAALEEQSYYRGKCIQIMQNRDYTTASLRNLGFEVIDSLANFVFATSSQISGDALYRRLKECGILIRHFNMPRISNFNRITIGTRVQMERLIYTISEILEENK